jgi:hypothetical protein
MKLTAIYSLFLFTAAYAVPASESTPPHILACGSIAACKTKGQKVWDLVQSATTDTPDTDTKYKASYQTLEKKSTIETVFNVGKRVKTIMKSPGINVDVSKKLNHVLIKGKGDSGAVAYEHLFDKGLIVAVNIFKAEDPVAKEAQVNWDVVAFEQYKELLPQNVKDLKYVMNFEIKPDDTKNVLKEVYVAAGKEADVTKDDTDWEMWTHDAHADAFLGLLGTDNGNGAGFLLVDYAATLGKKKIAGILTRRQEGQWSIVVEYTAGAEISSDSTSFLVEQKNALSGFMANLFA